MSTNPEHTPFDPQVRVSVASLVELTRQRNQLAERVKRLEEAGDRLEQHTKAHDDSEMFSCEKARAYALRTWNEAKDDQT